VKVTKTVIMITVLSEGVSPLEFKDLQDLQYMMDQGNEIGQCRVVSTEVLSDPRRIVGELLSIGNDGTFFDQV